MRINGRFLRPANLAERRLLLSLGVPSLKVPRGFNPFAVARRLRRAAQGGYAERDLLRELAAAQVRVATHENQARAA